ncbi:hypothetical protein V2J09_011176 [Rumex salicifolius]
MTDNELNQVLEIQNFIGSALHLDYRGHTISTGALLQASDNPSAHYWLSEIFSQATADDEVTWDDIVILKKDVWLSTYDWIDPQPTKVIVNLIRSTSCIMVTLLLLKVSLCRERERAGSGMGQISNANWVISFSCLRASCSKMALLVGIQTFHRKRRSRSGKLLVLLVLEFIYVTFGVHAHLFYQPQDLQKAASLTCLEGTKWWGGTIKENSSNITFSLYTSLVCDALCNSQKCSNGSSMHQRSVDQRQDDQRI